MSVIILYCGLCYLMAFVAAIHTKHTPWPLVLFAPISVAISLSFIYCKALNYTFGD